MRSKLTIVNKRILSSIFAFCILLSSSLIFNIDVRADDEPEYVEETAAELKDFWAIEGPNLVYTNYSGQRRTNLAWGTAGVTISRCSSDKTLINGPDSEWIALAIYDDYDNRDQRNIITSDGKTMVKEVTTITLSRIYNEIVDWGYDEWAAEFKRFYIDKINLDDVVYIRLDFIGIIRVYESLTSSNNIGGGNYYSSTHQFLGDVYLNNPPNDGLNPTQMIYNAKNPKTGNTISWSAGTRRDLEDLFNIYLPSEGDPHEVVSPTLTASSLYETKNYSSVYNISKAIPSGESVSNVVSGSSFIGDASVNTTTASHSYSVTYKYYYETKHEPLTYVGRTYVNTTYEFTGAGSDYSSRYNPELRRNDYLYTPGTGYYSKVDHYRGNGHYNSNGSYNSDGEYDYVWDGTYDKHYYPDVAFNFTAYVDYQYLSSIDLSAISNMTVYNNAFPGGSISYDTTALSNTTVTAELILRSQSASAAGRSFDHIYSGTNLSGYNFTPNSGHYSFAANPAGQEVGLGEGYDIDEYNTRVAADRASLISSVANDCSSRNDLFVVNDSGTAISFMSDTVCYGATISIDGSTYSYGTQAATSSHAYNSLAGYVNSLSAKRATGSRTVTIPTTVANADYPTGMTASYTGLFNGGTVSSFGAGRNFGYSDSIYNHVISGGVLSDHNGGDPNDGYPIRVHTPVVAPFKIVFNDGSDAIEHTQLVSSKVNTSAEYELLLDRMYYIEFESDNWYSQLYGTPPGYTNALDQYVQKKMVRFPFSVVYNGVYYPKTGSGYTVWIEIEAPADISEYWASGVNTDNYESNNHWQMMPFYIPSMSEECGVSGVTNYVEVAVYAYNHTGADLADDDENAVNIELSNALTSEYIATARRQVQMSGWLYDFSVVGTTNQAIYTGNGLMSTNYFDKIKPWSLANIKYEMKTSATNRLGTGNIRFLSDGTLALGGLNLIQTLPLRNGQSLFANTYGNVWLGETFSFTVKTMANLSGSNDFVRVIPHFKYQLSDGTVLDQDSGDFKLYTVSEGEDSVRIKEFNHNDYSLSSATSISLNNGLFDNAYYDDEDCFGYHQYGNWAVASANKENLNNAAGGYYSSITAEEFLSRKTTSYNLNTIYIPKTLRLCSGEYEQLQINDGRIYDRSTGVTGLTTYWDSISNYTPEIEENFKYSMQQWQSAYQVPTNTYIVDTRGIGGSLFNINNYIENSTMFSWETSPIVINGNGTLIVEFEIVAYKNNAPYLTYDGTNYIYVANIDVDRSIKDFIEPGILNIN